MIKAQPEPMQYFDWIDKYKPIMNTDTDVEYPQAYETFISDTYEYDWNAMLNKATELANGDPNKAFLHIWTKVSTDDGADLILVNGIRKVNRIQYFVCKIPFANTIEDGVKLYQEAHDD